VELVALLRLSNWDAFTLLGISDALLDALPKAGAAEREDLRDALFEVYERHFAVPGEGDLPFTLGLLLYELADYEEALACFEASRERFGPDSATDYNIELCRTELAKRQT
jgi:tetratricopeptide (TPR) repeat protein